MDTGYKNYYYIENKGCVGTGTLCPKLHYYGGAPFLGLILLFFLIFFIFSKSETVYKLSTL
jgi:hypothetical protein